MAAERDTPPSSAPVDAASVKPGEAPPFRVAALPAVSPLAQTVDPDTEVREASTGFDCARIGAKLDQGNGALALSGHVRSEAERLRLIERAGEVEGVGHVDASELRIVGDPYCHVLTFLDSAGLERSEDQRQDLAAMGSSAQAGIARYGVGSPLELTLAAPNFDSFIYVDYFSSDGKVHHLLPADRPDNRFAADQKVRIGADQGRGRRAVIGPPFGLDLIVAVASSEPLYLGARPAIEGAADYLASLEASIRS